MSLSFGLSPLLLIPALLAAIALAVWVHRNTVPALAPAKRLLLTALRAAALLIILFLLFEPILERRLQTERPPVLAVLVDNSQSLLLTDMNGDSLTASAGEDVRDAVRAVLGADYPGELNLFQFDADLQERPTNGPAEADSIGFTGERTNISAALEQVRDALSNKNLQGVLLISDGQYNTGRNPMYLAERFPVPIHTVVIGDTTRRRDLQIRSVTTNEIAFVGDDLPVRVGLRTEDFAGERVQVALLENGALLANETVDLPAGTVEIPIDLNHIPTEEGYRRLTVTVTRLEGEATYRNNSETVTVRVLRNKRQILLIASAPDPDVAAIRQLLETNANTEVTAAVQKGAGSFYGQPALDSLASFDAMILVGYPGAQADPAFLQRLSDTARDGVPVFFILGRQTDLRRLQQAFAETLPLEVQVVRSNAVEAAFVPTAAGLQHPVLEAFAANPDAWKQLPPLVMNDSRWQPWPDTRVLAVNEVRGVRLDDPLLAIRHRDGHRSAALLASGIWRWKNVPEDLSEAGEAWTLLFSNVLQWITTREDDRPVRVAPNEQLFSGGESVTFGGQVYDESLNPIDGAEVELDVMAADSTRYPYSMDGIGNGRYALDIGALPEGSYRYRAFANRNGAPLGEDQGSFAVGALTLEFKETSANPSLLRQIAARSGGNFLDPVNLNNLPDLLLESGRFVSTFTEERQDEELRRLYLFFAIVVTLLTVEWLIRKRSGLV
ncbi:MAG: VWA domain-containing protein [Rhodothermales bacterium]|nr:VWA domain-containing protein [Rhodothermales bacterium]